MSKILSRDDILSANDLPKELVEVPEWGGSVYVRGLNGLERDKFEISCAEQKGKNTTLNLENVRSKLLVLTICDEDGNRLFNDADLANFCKKSAIPISKLFDIAQRLSGLLDNDIKKMSEDFLPSQGGDSISA